jgi:hypothetical protein
MPQGAGGHVASPDKVVVQGHVIIWQVVVSSTKTIPHAKASQLAAAYLLQP